MATTYDGVPVLRSSNFTRPEDIIGRANVVVGEYGKATIVMEVSKDFVQFLDLGRLQALTLSAFVDRVDPEAAKEYWSKQQP